MDSMQVAAGVTNILLAVILPIPYIRILYIFISRSKYRYLECYRIMIQIGVVQCATAPGFFFFGLTHLCNEDVLKLGATFMKVMTTGVRLEAMLSFVLSLNRLKIMCGLRYPSYIHTTIALASWMFGIAYFTLLMTPLCTYLVEPGTYLAMYDVTKGQTFILAKVGSVALVSAISLTLVSYFVIITYLINLQKKTLRKIPNLKQEKTILLYGLLRFLVDISLAVLFNFGKLPHKPWIDYPIFLGHVLSGLLLPPALYLGLNRQLRTEFFGGESTNVVTVSTRFSNNKP